MKRCCVCVPVMCYVVKTKHTNMQAIPLHSNAFLNRQEVCFIKCDLTRLVCQAIFMVALCDRPQERITLALWIAASGKLTEITRTWTRLSFLPFALRGAVSCVQRTHLPRCCFVAQLPGTLPETTSTLLNAIECHLSCNRMRDHTWVSVQKALCLVLVFLLLFSRLIFEFKYLPGIGDCSSASKVFSVFSH